MAAGSASTPGEATSHAHSRPVIVSATYTFEPSGDRPTPFGVISGKTTSVIDDPSAWA